MAFWTWIFKDLEFGVFFLLGMKQPNILFVIQLHILINMLSLRFAENLREEPNKILKNGQQVYRSYTLLQFYYSNNNFRLTLIVLTFKKKAHIRLFIHFNAWRYL